MEWLRRLLARRALQLGGVGLLGLALLAALLPQASSEAGALGFAGAKGLWGNRPAARYRLTTAIDFHGRLNIHGRPAPPCQRTGEVLEELEVKLLANTCPGSMIAARPHEPPRPFPIHPRYGIVPVDWRPAISDLFAEIEAYERLLPVDMGPCEMTYLPAEVEYDPQLGYPGTIVFEARVRIKWQAGEAWRYLWDHRSLPGCEANLRTTITASVRTLP